MDKTIAARFIRDNFEPQDRLAIVILDKRTDEIVQRLATAERIQEDSFQSWLRAMNAKKQEIFVSMNALDPQKWGRTKEQVTAIRHVYLDLDTDGTAAVERLLKREDLPKPNQLVNSSPDKWQVIWKVENFSKDQAETLMRNLVRETGADPAATDVSRVLRLPGYYNHKYEKPHFVRVENVSREVYQPSHFPAKQFEDAGEAGKEYQHFEPGRARSAGEITQSERDWAFAKRALASGKSQDEIIAAIASYRTDKPNPQYYAAHTVQKAARAFERSKQESDTSGNESTDREVSR